MHISGRGYEKKYMVSVCASLIILIWKGGLSLLLNLHQPIVLILCCSCKSISAKGISIHHLACICEEPLAKKIIWLPKSMLFWSCSFFEGKWINFTWQARISMWLSHTYLDKTNFHSWTGLLKEKKTYHSNLCRYRFWMKKKLYCICIFLILSIIQEASLYSQSLTAKFHKRMPLYNYKKIVVSNWSLCENKTICPHEGFYSRCTSQFCPSNFHLFQCRIQDWVSLNGFCKDLV